MSDPQTTAFHVGPDPDAPDMFAVLDAAGGVFDGPHETAEDAEVARDVAAQAAPSGPLDDITIRYHAAMPKWCKLIGLEIRACYPSEGGGFMVRRDQAEAIIALLQLPGVNEHGG